MARWIFDQLYIEYPAQGPFDINSFGLVNRYSFFSMIYYPQSAPLFHQQKQVYLKLLDIVTVIVWGNSWKDSKTILAFNGVPDKLHCTGHLHADLNSLILVHNKERLLVDPGHTCYRTFIHEYGASTKAHNTCTFKYEAEGRVTRKHGEKCFTPTKHMRQKRNI